MLREPPDVHIPGLPCVLAVEVCEVAECRVCCGSGRLACARCSGTGLRAGSVLRCGVCAQGSVRCPYCAPHESECCRPHPNEELLDDGFSVVPARCHPHGWTPYVDVL